MKGGFVIHHDDGFGRQTDGEAASHRIRDREPRGRVMQAAAHHHAEAAEHIHFTEKLRHVGREVLVRVRKPHEIRNNFAERGELTARY